MSNKIFLSLALVATLSLVPAGCTTTTRPPATAGQSMMDKLGATIKSSAGKVTSAVTPKAAPAVTTPNGKPTPAVFVAFGQMKERGGNFDEAEIQYKKALDLDANDLNALVSYAHLQDRRNNLTDATKLYQKALKKHGKEASVHNDLGLCYHRRAMMGEATKELQKAIELKPDRKLYRDNLAAVLIDQGKNADALAQLTVAHGEAVANYNLGFLLVQKKNNAAALNYFRAAVEKDPTLVAAQQWMQRLAPGVAATDPRTSGPVLGEAMPVAPGSNVPSLQTARAMPVTPDANSSRRYVPADPPAGYPAQNVGTATPNGVQFPQVRRPDSSGYAVPPTPEQVGP